MTEDAFVAAVTEGQPVRPHYFAFDARTNREPHALLDEHTPPLLGLDDVLARPEADAVLLDAREPADFAVAHLAGAVNIGLQGRFAGWAGDVLPPDRDIILAGDPALAAEAKIRLARVGLDRVVGQLTDPASVFGGRPELVERSSGPRPVPEQGTGLLLAVCARICARDATHRGETAETPRPCRGHAPPEREGHRGHRRTGETAEMYVLWLITQRGPR